MQRYNMLTMIVKEELTDKEFKAGGLLRKSGLVIESK